MILFALEIEDTSVVTMAFVFNISDAMPGIVAVNM